jgi:hypothetical protein
MTDEKFVPMPKIPRLRREVIVTEKIDGTNASVHIDEAGNVRAASRTRWITPEDDNFGFAAWVRDHEDELRLLGPGHHFGEWWGNGIQRNYGLRQGDRRFSLFNVGRWLLDPPSPYASTPQLNVRALGVPGCVDVVPRLWQGTWDELGRDFHHAYSVLDEILHQLRMHGSYAVNYMNPEGIVVYHVAANQLFKVTLDNDDAPKSVARTQELAAA